MLQIHEASFPHMFFIQIYPRLASRIPGWTQTYCVPEACFELLILFSCKPSLPSAGNIGMYHHVQPLLYF